MMIDELQERAERVFRAARDSLLLVVLVVAGGWAVSDAAKGSPATPGGR